ncbi:MAG: hypothetical protein KJ067_14485 [Vicinamibacteria bacterium]|nr:hypothetical protein [Vicinamibacteria bacterium]
MTDLLHLNPFVANAVHEAEIWGEDDGEFRDVGSIHRAPFETLLADLRAVAADPRHTTRVRFLVGPGGSGKSHLFSRVRRGTGDRAIFAFASNPPMRASALLLWTLDKVVGGLRRPRLIAGQAKPYSQLEALLYLLLLKQGLGLVEDSLDDLHEFWRSVSDAARDDYLERAHRRLAAEGYEPRSLRSLLCVLRPEVRDVAFQWLSGSSNLLDEELQALGQRLPIEDAEAQELLKRLGLLSTLAEAPLVLVLDQLDLMTAPDQIDELQRLLFTLINESRNWCVVIGLIEDKFSLWKERLSEALRTRVQTPEGQLPVVDLQALSAAEQKQELLRRRLATRALAAARREAGVADALHPMTEADCRALASGPPVFARELLARASGLYAQRATGREPSADGATAEAEQLDSRLHLEFRARRERLDPQQLALERASLADRIGEAVELLALAQGLGPVSSSVGPLENDARFKGTDTVLRIGDATLRVLGHHVHRGRAFPTFLTQVTAVPAPALLVRDGAAGITGAVTSERLAEFARTRSFLHLPRPAIADLVALGELLAEVREGNFSRLATSPPPSDTNVKAALATLPWITQGPLARAVLAALDRSDAPAEAPTPAPPTPGTPSVPGPVPLPPASTDVTTAVETILRSARWLMLERLRLWLARAHHDLSLEQLRATLGEPPLSRSVLVYPRTVRAAADVQVLVWNGDDA